MAPRGAPTSRMAAAAAVAAKATSNTKWMGCGGVSSRPKQPHEPSIVPARRAATTKAPNAR